MEGRFHMGVFAPIFGSKRERDKSVHFPSKVSQVPLAQNNSK